MFIYFEVRRPAFFQGTPILRFSHKKMDKEETVSLVLQVSGRCEVTWISKLAQLARCGILESYTFLKNGLEMFYQQNHPAWWEGMLPKGRSSYRNRRRAPALIQ